MINHGVRFLRTLNVREGKISIILMEYVSFLVPYRLEQYDIILLGACVTDIGAFSACDLDEVTRNTQIIMHLNTPILPTVLDNLECH